MKKMIVAKLACNDRILKSSCNIDVEDIKDVVTTALSGSSFTVSRVDLVYARVSEKYFLDCQELGYDYGFFRRNTILARCYLTMNRSNGACFEGVYLPFSGEMYLIPEGVLEFSDIPLEENYEVVLSQTGAEKKVRRFKIHQATEKNKRSFQERFSGTMPSLPVSKTIACFEAAADVKKNISGKGTTEEEVLDPMYFLYAND